MGGERKVSKWEEALDVEAGKRSQAWVFRAACPVSPRLPEGIMNRYMGRSSAPNIFTFGEVDYKYVRDTPGCFLLYSRGIQ